ncbi:hypothetical protein BCR43DRAFT_527553 [Syncephalastrum racemosum]|uniref:Pentacotripeptide-repeat region of PRORP domain-containing protein n=1 Tax=Syncephalastrum racemosum TaxID=13706 RepID=A0A1X2H3K3_SYNRA|nr:hypothetical protein BCR43DRAFT_527553 [Syncephalastrum racemosum]
MSTSPIFICGTNSCKDYKKRQHTSRRRSRPSTPPDTDVDTSLIYKHNAKEDDQRAVDLPTPPPSPGGSERCLTAVHEANGRILAAKRAGNLKAVMVEFASMKKQNLPLTHHTYNLVLDAHASLRREGTPLTSVLNIFQEMAPISPSSYTYAILLRLLCKRDVEVQKTVAMLRRQSARTGQSTEDIPGLESEGNVSRAMALFRECHEQNLAWELEIDIYNQLLRVLSHYGNAADAQFVYDRLIESPAAKPNSATFAALINLLGRAGLLEDALTFFETYKSLRDDMGAHDASYVYNALVDAYLKCDRLDDALRVLEHDMVMNNVKITIIPYNSILRHYCARGQMDLARKLVRKLEGSEPAVDASSYGPILAAYCQAGQWQEASTMYDALLRTNISKAYGNLASYSLLCLAHGQGERALKVVRDMVQAGLEPDAVLSSRSISHFARHHAFHEAVACLEFVQESMSTRSLTKGTNNLIKSALQIVHAQAECRLSHVLRIAQALSPVLATQQQQPFPLILAETLLNAYWNAPSQDKREALMQSTYASHLCEAALTLDTCLGPWADDALASCADSDMGLSMVITPALSSRILTRLQKQGEVQIASAWHVAVMGPAALDEERGAEISSAVLSAAMRGRSTEAIRILERKILSRGQAPSPEILRDAISVIGKQGELDAAATLYRLSVEAYNQRIQDGKTRAHAIYLATNSILISYAQKGDMVRAKEYYDQIKEMGFFPDGNAYASLLLGSATCATDEATDALTIYDEAKRHNVKPTTFFYNVVISKLAKARKLEPALMLFDEMRQFKVPANSITFGAMISACVRAGSEVQARRLFGEMLSSPSYQPRVGPFNNMMQFYVRQQPDRARVLEYFGELRRRHIKPSAHTYKLLMEAYASIAPYDMPTAHRMLTEMVRRDNLVPQAAHYATLIYSYGSLQRDVKSADRVFAEMTKAKLRPDEAVYQAMLDALISNDQLDRAEAMYTRMLRDITKSASPYIENLFIRGYGRKGTVYKAEAIFEAMSDDKLLHVHSSSSAISHARNSDSQIGTESKQESRTVVVREPSTYEAMVIAYLDNGMHHKAKEVLDRMIQRDFPPKVLATVADLVLE